MKKNLHIFTLSLFLLGFTLLGCSQDKFTGPSQSSSPGVNSNGNPGGTDTSNPVAPGDGDLASCNAPTADSDEEPLTVENGYFGRPVEIISSAVEGTTAANTASALAACQTYAQIIGTMTGNTDSTISLVAGCTQYEDVQEIQFTMNVHSDQLQTGGDSVEFATCPLPYDLNIPFSYTSDMGIIAPNDCVTKMGFINYYAGSGLGGYYSFAQCQMLDGTNAKLVITVSKP